MIESNFFDVINLLIIGNKKTTVDNTVVSKNENNNNLLISKKLDYQTIHRDIVLHCQDGKRTAQFELYRLYSKAMYNVCLRMVKNEADAEDLLQNSFTDVFTKIHTFRFESTIGAWIKRITVNNCINFLKKRRLDLQEIDDRIHGMPDEDKDVQSDSSLTVNTVNEALMQLSDGYRIVFSLYCMEGYDHKEIGQILGVSEATSKSQYSRAKAKLRKILAETLA